ncbi:MAG: methionine synthase [Methanomassiliicoccales archaeon]|nr:MAG: methionine synthase [Methanomassiliicoccales archaeon]
MDWNCASTCIGSLPHTDPKKALDLIMSHLKEVPFWPQLPNLGFGENMYAQFSTKLPGIRIDAEAKKVTVDLNDYDPEAFYIAVVEEDLDHFAYEEENFHGLFELLRRMPSGARAVKGQVTGPISTGLQIFDQNGKSALYDDFYGEIIRRDLNFCARWQEKKLKEMNDNVVIFLDEPSLSLVGTPFAPIPHEKVVLWINEVLDGLSCIKGLHCCGNTDWPMVLSTNIDLLSFDAYSYAFSIALYPKEVSSFLERGGALSWGIVPNMDSRIDKETVHSLVARLEDGIGSLVSKGVDRDLLLERSVLTPQCGLGGLDEERCGRVLELLTGVSEEMRRRHGLGE